MSNDFRITFTMDMTMFLHTYSCKVVVVDVFVELFTRKLGCERTTIKRSDDVGSLWSR